MKRVLSFFILLILLVNPGILVCDAKTEENKSSEAVIVQTFTQKNNLYAYVDIPEHMAENGLGVSAELENERLSPTLFTKAFQSDQPVSYLFLVDSSSSVASFGKTINEFIQYVIEESSENSRYAIASFGDKFELISDFTKGGKKKKANLPKLTYNSLNTGLYSGITDAVHFYHNRERRDGELYNIIVISDGIEDTAGLNKNEVSFSDLTHTAEKSQILIHTLGLKAENPKSEQSLKDMKEISKISSGIHAVYEKDKSSVKNCADSMLKPFRRFYESCFDLSFLQSRGKRYTLNLFFQLNGEFIFKTAAEIEIPLGTEDNLGDQSGIDKVSGSPAHSDGAKSFVPKNKTMILAAAIGMILVFAVLAACVVIHRKKRKNAEDQKAGIFMKLEVLSGHCSSKTGEYYLVQELFIGRKKNCDIIFKDKQVSNRNSRIFAHEHMIYIEDLNSAYGTAISEMKLYAPNRLRSGDEISIGSVIFKLKF